MGLVEVKVKMKLKHNVKLTHKDYGFKKSGALRGVLSIEWVGGAFVVSLLCLWFIAGSGCGGRTVSGVNVNQNDDSGVPDAHISDGTVQPDSSLSDALPPDAWQPCEYEDSWTLEPAILEEITVLNPMATGTGIPEGVSVRIKAMIPVTGCDRMAGVQYTMYGGGTEGIIELSGFVWRYEGDRPCPDMMQFVPEFFSFPGLSVGEWEVYDALIDGPPTLFTVRTCMDGEDCYCDFWNGVPGDWGSSCNHDCMCQDELGCNYEGDTMNPGVCYETCSVTADCPVGLFCHHDMLSDTPNGVCLTTGLIDECVEGGCEPGFECRHNPEVGYRVCTAVMDPDYMDTPCEIDCDCPAGFSCLSLPYFDNKTCQIMCRGNQDCPDGIGIYCDGPGHLENLLICAFVAEPFD